jgi:hypothetical protein
MLLRRLNFELTHDMQISKKIPLLVFVFLSFVLGATAQPSSDAELKRDKSATNSFKDPKTGFTLWYNPEHWTPDDRPTSAFDLNHTTEPIWSMIIPEKFKMSKKAYRNFLIDKFFSKVKDGKLAKEEARKVNGKDLVYMVFEGDQNKLRVPYIYAGYFYTGAEGVCQVFVGLEKEFFTPEVEKEIITLLNGFEVEAKGQ